MRGIRLHPLAFLWATLFGTLGAHWLDYVIVHDDPHARAALLAATGHGYQSAARLVGLVGFGVLLGWAAVAGASRHRTGAKLHRPSIAAAVLAVAQLAMFVAVEVVERLVVGVPPSALLRGPLLALGLALQPLVAVAVVAGVVAVERLAAVVAPPRLVLPTLLVAPLAVEGVPVSPVAARHHTPERGRAPPRLG